MNNLVPEKRMDKNGKLVTKHVRSGPAQPSKLMDAPAPSLAKKAAAFKPTAKQLEQRKMDFRNIIGLDGHFAVFTASETEFYDVLSASASSETALVALIQGCRSKEETLEFLAVTGETNELADRSALTQEAMRRRIKPEDFGDGYAWVEHKCSLSKHVEIDESSPEGIGRLLDTIEFYASLNKGNNGLVWNKIMNGDISYEDIKNIGIPKLKSYNRLHSLSDALVRLHAGEADYDIDDLKRLVDRDVEEKKASMSGYSTRNTENIFSVASQAVINKGMRFIDEAQSLDDIAKNYWSYQPSSRYRNTEYGKSELWDKVAYVTLAKARYEESGARWTSVYSARLDDMHDAGIPLDIAVEVIAAGGSVLEAKAIHEEGINKSVSGGWL